MGRSVQINPLSLWERARVREALKGRKILPFIRVF